jgi:hypothetical protein
MDTKRRIFELIIKGYTKQQIVSLIPELTMNQLTYIMRKNHWKISKKTKAYAIYSGRDQYVKTNIIVRQDKNYKECPFIGVSIHHKSVFTKQTVYVTAITYKKKRYKKASNNIRLVLKYRDDFYREHMPEKLNIIKKKELIWFLKHPFNKFFFNFLKYKLNLI